MKTQWLLLCALIFALITAVFAVSNVESVRVNFLFRTTEIPLILIILGSTLLGGLIVFSFGIIRQYKLQRTVKQLSKELDGLKQKQQEETTAITTVQKDSSEEHTEAESSGALEADAVQSPKTQEDDATKDKGKEAALEVGTALKKDS